MPDRDDALGPCDHCGGEVGSRGWMIATGMSDDDTPVVEVACSETCRDAITPRCDQFAQFMLRQRAAALTGPKEQVS